MKNNNVIDLNISLSEVEYLNKELEKKAQKAADNKFGSKQSYVKSLYKLKWYKDNGGKVKYSGKKPSKQKVSKQVKGREIEFEIDLISEAAEYQGKKVTLNKPFRTPKGPKKFAVYVKNDKGNVVLVRFGDPKLSIKRSDPERRKSFRARHGCDNPGPKWKAKYWSCQWSWSPSKKVAASEDFTQEEFDWENLPEENELFPNGLPEFDQEETESEEEGCC